jgi:hypothetical protein
MEVLSEVEMNIAKRIAMDENSSVGEEGSNYFCFFFFRLYCHFFQEKVQNNFVEITIAAQWISRRRK